MPKVFIFLHWCLYIIDGTERGELVLRGDGIAFQESLEGLPIFTLNHYFYLMLTLLGFIFFVLVYVQSLQKCIAVV